MISRRILRIKILQVLYAYFQSDDKSLQKSDKELNFSIQKFYDLYHYLLLLIIELGRYTESRIDLARNKYVPSKEDLQPNVKFINNIAINRIVNDSQFQKYLSNQKLSWVNHPDIIKTLYHSLSDNEDFIRYMETPGQNFEEDKKIIISFFSKQLPEFEPLYQCLEEQSIYWNDEVDFVISMIIKTFKEMSEDADVPVLFPLYHSDEDREFASILFRKTIMNDNYYQKQIELIANNWDLERIAFLDLLLMKMAISEAIEFPSIPTKVTLNEYIEISKYYSTEKSGNFINGILDKVFHALKEEKVIVKTGRGLIGEVLCFQRGSSYILTTEESVVSCLSSLYYPVQTTIIKESKPTT
jgi:transcription antitermination protein NusB